MRSSVVVRRLILLGAFLALPALVFAQEATLTGTITDSTGGVLPGVTVVAVNEASGNQFESVTDARGVYRIPARVGTYRITASLTGFSTVNRQGVNLLVGQTATINLQMAPSTLQETVTVTGEAPPTNATAPLPDRNGGEQREFQLNLDGQQIGSELGAGNQPRFSQDSIAEFQFITNQFDATQGRSTGVQVNAITKSGTNQLNGLFRSNFQSSRFNAEDPVAHRVIPVSIQQYSTAVGGPVIKDKLHFFGNFEYERHPLTSVWTTPYPAFNIALSGKSTRHLQGIRLDYQLSSKTRIMGKASGQRSTDPFGNGSSTSHPASTIDQDERNQEYIGQFTQVLSNRSLNEVRGGYSHYGFANNTLVTWSKHWQAPRVTNGYPRITFSGFAVNANQNAPRHRDQKVWQIRDDYTTSYDAKGHHDLKLGAEFVRHFEDSENCAMCGGNIDARNGTVPAGLMQTLFPDPFNADTWNFAAISPFVRTYTIGIGQFPNQYGQPKYAGWAQDDWRMTTRLVLNLGLRYDLSINAWANDLGFEPFYRAGRPNDTNNLQPRVGFAYQLNDRTVIRGGSGVYFADALTVDAFWPKYNTQLSRIQLNNDGRPDFAANPLNGQPLPTYEQAQSQFCHSAAQAANFARWQASNYTGNAPCLLLTTQEMPAPDQYMQMARAWTTSIGFQRQFGAVTQVQADYIYRKGDHEKDTLDNINLAYNPATGVNYPYAASGPGRALLPYPQYGTMSMIPHNTRSRYEAVQTAFTPRQRLHLRAGRSAPPLRVQRYLGDHARPAAERRALLRRGHPLEHELRLRPSERRHRRLVASPLGRDDRGAQQLHAAGSEQDRHPPAAAASARRPELHRSDRGSVQRVQPGELQPGDERERGELQQAVDRAEPLGAARVPADVLVSS
ncbi:MAG: hypothetical protein DMF87_05065 [Acidobacteria bacterium]|nr:MAG: hypothetical protein DMF87_05065 [Acidobacteriota bacterium]